MKNVIYNLSGTNDLNSCHESDSDEVDIDKGDSDDANGSNSTSIDSSESDKIRASDKVNIDAYIPTAAWFTTEKITYNTVTDNPSESSNFNPLGDDLFEGQYFVISKLS